MARTPRVATGFTSYSQNDLLLKAQQISLSMNDNPNFLTPVPDLVTVNAAIAAYALTLANAPSKTNTAAKKAARGQLIALLNQLALYILMTAGGDITAMLSSSYSLTKLPQPVGILAKPENFKVLPVHNSSAKLSLNKIDGADGYRFEYTSAPATEDSTWTSVLSTKANTIISGLNSGSRYAFRVAGVGSNPTIVYSDEVVSYIL